MSEELKDEICEETAEEAAEKNTAAEQAAAEAAEEASAEEKLKAELAALDDKYKRVLAEYDNFRKRSLKERDAFFGDGVMSAAASFLPLIDNLERAAAASSDEGVKLIERQSQEIMQKLNIKAVGQEGEDFDPNIHNAVAHIDDESLGENVVAEVLQKGYMLGDRLIRPAMVKTAN